ncbi:ABC transporter substrate-binding protein [Amycolatopsis sp. GM8]|uniref:ABC transporter substrate-binding protein n=1 Tax=Amycolatopsis sp. GM8 TaxID=2896530 RepID=UPI001F440A89|nr:ABC transporter substrate-binding protein [Amycolatopsis sp. GM8]
MSTSWRALGAGAAAATLALSLVACGSSSGSSSGSTSGDSSGAGDPIKIGLIGSFSGPAGTGLTAAKLSEMAWVSSVNDTGGINGHPVQLFVEDDGGDPAKSVSAMKNLVEKDGVVAIVGSIEFGLEQAWTNYVDGKKIPVIGGASSVPAWETDPNFYPVGNSTSNVSRMTAYGGKLSNKNNFGFAYCAEYPSCKQASVKYEQFVKDLGMTYASGQGVPASAPNYTSQCLAFKNANANSIFLATQPDVTPRIVSSCKAQGYQPLFIVDSATYLDSYLTDPAFEGILLSSEGPLWFGDGPGTADYTAAMKKYQPTAQQNSIGVISWYGGKVFEAAVKASGVTGKPTSQNITDGLHKLGPNFDLGGSIAPVTYKAGAGAVQQSCGWYASIQNGKLTTPFGAKRICLN